MISVAAQTQNMLGEGPMWDEHRQCLWWVDILRSQLWKLDYQTKKYQFWYLPSPASMVAVHSNMEYLILVCKGGFYTFHPATEKSEKVADFENDIPGNRPNDGKVDPAGRIWVGSMDNTEKAKTGTLYRVSADYDLTPVSKGIGIPNTFAWSPDRKHFYFADSLEQTIWKFAYDEASGAISDRLEFVSLKKTDCFPDGSAMDCEGYLWNAQWNGWRIVRYAPDGSEDQIIEMPVSCPTSCMFGGKDNKTLFVTSARKGQTSQELKLQPDAGALFKIELPVGGLLPNLVL